MKPPRFEYTAPTTLDEALSELVRGGEDAKILAGGQSLVPLLNFRLARPSLLVDINGVEELAYVRREHGALRLGAMTRQSVAERSPLVREHWPLLAAALSRVAHPQIRNRGTVGGSAVHADPAAELPVAFAALEARFHVRSLRGARELTAEEMFVGQLESGLALDEILTEISVPPVDHADGWAFQEYARRHGDFALGGAAVQLQLSGGRCSAPAVALLGAGQTPMRAREAEAVLRGQTVTGDLAAHAAAAAVAHIRPTGDIHGDSDYRRGLIESLTRRAILDAGGLPWRPVSERAA